MKALTILQPWAHLIVHHTKRVENRTWRTDYRGPLAIHAGKGRSELAGLEPFEAAEMCCISTIGREHHRGALSRGERMEFGAVIGTARLVDCFRIENLTKHHEQEPWAYGPWCWLLADVVALPEPIPARGAQGLWDWDFGTGEKGKKGENVTATSALVRRVRRVRT